MQKISFAGWPVPEQLARLLRQMSQILDMLRTGDVLTHCYSGAPNIAGKFTNIVRLCSASVGRRLA
jgi:predicted amidohydrolase